MKKIIWLVFLLLLNVVNGLEIEAKEVYYSNYSDFSEYQEKEIFETDLIDVEEEQRYLWYKINNIVGDYQLYNLEDDYTDDCYLTDYSSWQDEKIDNAGYVYETRSKYEYTKAEKIRYVHLYNLQGSYGAFRMTELMVKINGEKNNYEYTCSGCLDGFDEHINNGIYDENQSYISNGGSLIIDLGKEYPINQIEVIFYIFDLGPSDKLYTIGYSKDKKDIFIAQSYTLNFADEYWDNALKVSRKITDLNIDISEWTTVETSYTKQDGDDIIDVKSNLQYRYQEKWCRTIQSEKEYYSIYSVSEVADYPYRDDESRKIFYRYRTRDKLELEIYEITSNNFDLNNFVIFNSDDVKIENNINWNKNSTYELKFILNDLVVTKNVVLNIPENTIEELNKEIDKLNQQILILQEELLHQQKNYDVKIEELNIKINNCQLENSCLLDIVAEKESIIKNQEKELNDLIDKVNDFKSELINKNDQLTLLSKNNKLLNEIVENFKLNILKIKQNSNKLSEDIIVEYNSRIDELDQLNNFYRQKIDELREDLKQLNENISDNLSENQQLIDKYQKQIKELEEANCKEYLNIDQNDQTLSNKLNNYVLKIYSNKLFGIITIIILILFIIYIILKNSRFKK